MMVIIPGRFAGLNEFVDANRRRHGNWSAGNSMKQKDQYTIMQYLPRVHIDKPVYLEYTFYERNSRRDKDNISGYFHKIFQDALVQAGVLSGDGWKNIVGFSDAFYVDNKNPRIEVYIEVMK